MIIQSKGLELQLDTFRLKGAQTLSVIILIPKMVHDWNKLLEEMVNFSSFDSFISRLDIKYEMGITVSALEITWKKQ